MANLKYIVILLLLAGCTSDEVQQNCMIVCDCNCDDENDSVYNNAAFVKIKMHNFNTDREDELTRGECKNGALTTEFPKTLDSNYLYELINSNWFPTNIINAPSTMTISNNNVKVGHAIFEVVTNEDNVATHIYPFKIDENCNAESVFYTYVDADVTISGFFKREVVICEYDISKNVDIWYKWQQTTTYSIEWKKGWNVWCLSISESRKERIITEQWKNSSAGELKWCRSEELWKLKL